jgi:hypothetical protein
VGAIGTTVAFDGLYLRAPLSVWDGEAIKVIESREQRELSPGYRYRADMTPGRTPQGVAFDGRMRDIKGNHVALVIEGRTGPDVLVADETPPEIFKMKFARFFAALTSAFPALKPEQALALDEALNQDLAPAVPPAVVPDPVKLAADAAAKVTADAVAVQLAVDAAVAEAVKDRVTKTDADRLATDAATAARAEVHALYVARKAVEPTAGVVALDSADAVYRFALDHLKVAHKDIPASALAALYDASAKATAAPANVPANAVAFDSSILGLSHIRKG